MTDRIKKLVVTLEDGSTREWVDSGTVQVERTGDTDSNQLKDNNIHYVTSTLKFDPPKESP